MIFALTFAMKQLVPDTVAPGVAGAIVGTSEFADAAGFAAHRPHPVPWAEKRQAIYTQMADHVAAHVDLEPVRSYLGL